MYDEMGRRSFEAALLTFYLTQSSLMLITTSQLVDRDTNFDLCALSVLFAPQGGALAAETTLDQPPADP